MKKWIAIFLCLLLTLGILSGCGGAAGSDTAATESQSAPNAAYDSATSEEMGIGYDMAPEAETGEGLTAEYGLKIIYETSLNIETLDFDQSCADILSAVQEYGGYVASQNSGGGYRYSNDRYISRYAEFVLRIPSENHTSFLQRGGSFGNVTSTSNSEQDITAQFIDTEARLDSLRAQETRLLEMLEMTASLEELLLLEDHLADIRYEIERYTSTLKTYENLTEFSTITIYLDEVSTITNTSNSFGARLKSALSGSLAEAGDFLQDLLIFLIYALPYLLIIGLIILVVRMLVKRRRQRQATRRAAMQAMMDAQNSANPEEKKP